MSIKLLDTIYKLTDNADKVDGKHASDFATSGHTHNLGNKNVADLSSTYPSGISVGGIYNNGYPFSYGSTITASGNGGYFQIAGQWNSNVTSSSDYDYPTEMYIRGRRDSYDVWTTWSRVLTNRNYTSFAAKHDHTHSNYASKITVGTTAYTCSSNNITIPAYPTIPTALKNPKALTIQNNGTTIDSYDGSAAKTINITHPTIPTSLKCPKSLTIQLNGTSQGAWDGSADKTINITPASIGASATHSHPYLPIAGGGNLTGSAYISFNSALANSTELTNSTPFGITYGRIQSYGSMNIAADTDGSTSEYLILTAGYSIANAVASNGLAIGYNALKWKGIDVSLSNHTHSYSDGYVMTHHIIDASGLNQNTYYPVTIPIGSSPNVRIEVIVSLNSGSVPSWSTHSSGFSVRKIWEVNGYGWGTNPMNRRILVSDYQYANADPVRGIGQLSNSSTEYVYVRGGGKYFFKVSHGIVPTLRTSEFVGTADPYYQSVSPTTSAPAGIGRNIAYTSDIPSSLKCPASLTIQLNGSSQGAWDGSSAKTINITPASIGASASHSHPYLPTAGGTMTGAINFQTGSQTALINARYDGTNYTNVLWHKHGDSSGVGSTVIFGSPQWENVILETKANQNCAYRQTSGTKYKIWDSGNDGSGSGLDADTLDGVHLMGKGGTSGVMRSWARGTYTTSKQYFGNGNVVVIDPNPTDDSSLWANTTIFSVGDMEIRSHQLAFGYNEDKILYRRIDDGPRYNAWKTIAFTDSKVNNAGYADNSGQLNGYGEGNYYRQSRGALNNANLNTFVKRNSGGYSINYSGYSGLLVSLQGNGGSTSSIEFIATHYDIKTGGLKVRYTIDSTWYGDTKSIAFLDSNVASASKLATARTISLTGSVTGSGSFDGSGNLSIATTTNHTHSYYPLSGNTNMSGDNVWIGSTMGGGTDYWRIGGTGTGDNGICRITIGDNSNDKFQIQIADYSGTTYTPLEVTYNKLNIVGLASITANGRTLTIGSQNADHCHYSTDAPCHWFNKLVRVAGDVYGGSSYNRRLAYVDEVALSGHTHSYVSTNIASSLNTATVNYANTPYGVNYRNHYSGHGLGSYRGVLTCKDNSVGFELNSYWCVNPADGVGTNNLYYRVKRDAASDWGPYARIIDSGNIGSQSVNYANSAGNANTVDGYHIVVGSTGSDASTIYIVT